MFSLMSFCSITLGGFEADRFYLGQWREGLGKLFSLWRPGHLDIVIDVSSDRGWLCGTRWRFLNVHWWMQTSPWRHLLITWFVPYFRALHAVSSTLKRLKIWDAVFINGIVSLPPARALLCATGSPIACFHAANEAGSVFLITPMTTLPTQPFRSTPNHVCIQKKDPVGRYICSMDLCTEDERAGHINKCLTSMRQFELTGG